MLYRRGGVWWWKFAFAGRTFRESAKTTSKDVARRAELKRRRELEEGYHGLKRRSAPESFSVAAAKWLELKKPTISAKSYIIEKTNLGHIKPVLGKLLLSDVSADDIARYQTQRLKEKARPYGDKLTSPKTVNLEVGTIRAILRRHRLWANLQPDVRLLSTRDDVGQALSSEEEKTLLHACSLSRSRSLMPVVLLSLNTGMRYSELRLLKWTQVDLEARAIKVGKSKTEAGAGRVIPLNSKASEILRFWAEAFPRRVPEHYVFPSERYGAGGDQFEVMVFDTDPEKPMTSWKEAWESVKKNTGLSVRFHDLRHTCVTRMLEGGAPLSVVASILGWSPATTVRMAKRYGHIGQVALRKAVEILDEKPKKTGRSTKRGHKIGHTQPDTGERAPLKH
jgi:integrase